MLLRNPAFLFLLILFISSCSVNRKSSSKNNSATKYTIEGPSNAVAYVERYKFIAVSESKRTGIPASIKLAQGILESGYGSSTLAKKANNHFGIKCGGKQWKGKKHYRKGSCYRVFKSGNDAYVEHSNFLTYNKRYDSLFVCKIVRRASLHRRVDSEWYIYAANEEMSIGRCYDICKIMD